MRASTLFVAAIATAATLSAGCVGTRNCRYVYQDGQYGVIGIPENTDRWPTRYRSCAERLMQEHFPGGHEIVRAEEVVEGTRTLTTEGSRTAELVPALPLELLEVCKLGGTSKRTQSDSLKITECRIVYRRVDRPAAEHYAETASLAPPAYIDPNAADRPRDPAVMAAGHEEAPADEEPAR